MVAAYTTGRSLHLVGVALIALTALTSQSQANMYDLTTANKSATINGAEFRTFDIAPTGTGNIQSFVRIQKNGSEQGYNTDVTKQADFPYDEKYGAFTHSLLLSGVPRVQLTPGGAWFYEFGLDINQNSKPLISLDKLMIFQESVGNLTVPVDSSVPSEQTLKSLGTLVYDLDDPAGTPELDNWIALDYSLGAGSGQGDMYAYIPTEAFKGSGPYVYLYSRFGDQDGYESNAGGEEWFVRTNVTPPLVPAPAAVLLGLFGLTTAGCKLRRFA